MFAFFIGKFLPTFRIKYSIHASTKYSTNIKFHISDNRHDTRLHEWVNTTLKCMKKTLLIFCSLHITQIRNCYNIKSDTKKYLLKLFDLDMKQLTTDSCDKCNRTINNSIFYTDKNIISRTVYQIPVQEHALYNKKNCIRSDKPYFVSLSTYMQLLLGFLCVICSGCFTNNK